MPKELPYETAHTLIQYHQDGAAQFALNVSTQCLERNDVTGASFWSAVAKAIEEIQRQSKAMH